VGGLTVVGVAVDAAHLDLVRRLCEPEVSAPEQLFRELLPSSVADAYLELIDQGSRVMSEGDPVDEELVARHLGYLQFSGAPVLRPIDPLVAISGLLTEVHRELSVQQGKLLKGYAAAAEFHQRQLRGDDVPSLLARTLTDADELAERWTTLVHTTQSKYRSISLQPAGSGLPMPMPQQSGISGFVLCSPVLLTDPRGADEIRTAIEAGVEVRTTQTLPIRMIVVDDKVALVGLVPDGTTAALMVRSAVLVAALAQYYDQLWAAATPVVLPEAVPVLRQRQLVRKLGGTEREVLALLAHGLKDEAIARHLSLSVRTVRRHVATVMEFVDAPTRFAAGAAAQRLGLLG
jgi:DNA-binding NarL/FixJ family response regulator